METYRRVDYYGNDNAFTDGYIQDRGEALIVSIFGAPELIKAVIASFLKGSGIRVMCENYPETLYRNSGTHYSVLQKRVSPDVVHAIIYQRDTISVNEIQPGGIAVLVDPTPEKYYRLINKKYPTPLLPYMAEDLYNRFVVRSNETIELGTFGKFGLAYSVQLPSQEELESAVITIVKIDPPKIN